MNLLVYFFRLGRLQYSLLVLSFILLLAGAIFEGISFCLLIPLFKQLFGSGVYSGGQISHMLQPFIKWINFDQLLEQPDWLIVILVAVVFIAQILLYGSQVLHHYAVKHFEARLKIEGYKKLITYGCLFFDNIQKGKVHHALMRYTREVVSLMKALFRAAKNSVLSLVYIAVLIYVSPWLSLISGIFLFIFFVFLRKFFLSIPRLYKKILRSEKSEHIVSLDVFSNIKLVKALNQETFVQNEFEMLSTLQAKEQVRVAALQALINPMLEIIMISAVGLMIWISLHSNLKQSEYFSSSLIVALVLFRRTFQTINELLHSWPTVLRCYPYVRELRDLFDENDKHLMPAGNKILKPLTSSIEFRNVSLRYGSGTTVLNDISFKVPANSFTAIVGETGAGKSSIAELMLRFYEFEKGEILFDGTSIRDYDAASLREQIGFVSQETLVFSDTVLNNIQCAKPGASRAEVMDAAQKACLIQTEKPGGINLDTVIGDKGVKLSGGELQRLSLARVFLRQSQIIILDEPTSALDAITEKAIQDALKRIVGKKTMIVIAHRLAAIKNADQIIVLKNGAIEARGVFQELLSQSGTFRECWTLQSL